MTPPCPRCHSPGLRDYDGYWCPSHGEYACTYQPPELFTESLRPVVLPWHQWTQQEALAWAAVLEPGETLPAGALEVLRR